MLQRVDFWTESIAKTFEHEISPQMNGDESTFEEEKFNLVCVNMCNIIYSLRSRENFLDMCKNLLAKPEHRRVLEEGLNKLNKLSKDQKDKPVFVLSTLLRKIESEKKASLQQSRLESAPISTLNQSHPSVYKRNKIFD